MKKKIPYIPKGRSFKYVDLSDPKMMTAKQVAESSQDKEHPTGAVIFLDDVCIGAGSNGSETHEREGCERKRQNIPTGEKYELCEGCHPKNHAEQKALKLAKALLGKFEGADLYLWGHWWACESCWKAMIKAGIRDVYLERE